MADLTGPLPAPPPARASVSPAAPFPARAEVSAGAARPALSARGAAVAASRWRLRPETGPGWERPRAFPLGLPALDAFPQQLWTRVLTRRARRSLGGLLGYQDPAGYRPLREAIAAYLGMARGVRCGPDQVLVVSGAQAGIDLAARLLLDPGDPVWVEDPGYYGARGALIGAGARLVPAPVDAGGLDLGAARRRQPDARLAYVTPSHQFPVGVTMSLARRLDLLAWAEAAGGYVLEDDYDSEYRYVGRPRPPSKGSTGRAGWSTSAASARCCSPHCGSATWSSPKAWSTPSPPPSASAEVHVPALEQAALADFIADGHLGRHVRRMRALYATRGRALIRAVRRQAPDALEVRSAHAGLHLVAWLPPGVDDRAAAERAAAAGVEAQALSDHALERPECGGLLLGYAAVPEPEVDQAVARLARALTGA